MLDAKPALPTKLWWPYAAAVIAGLFCMKGFQPIMTKMTMENGVLMYQVVVMSAIIDVSKILFCSIALPYQLSTAKDEAERQSLTAGLSVSMLLKYATPSMFFMVGSNLSYLSLQFVDSTTFLLFSNTKIVFTVILHSLAYKYNLTPRQWAAAVVVFVGCTVSQLDTSKTSDTPDEDGAVVLGIALNAFQTKLLGIALTILGVLVHVFASIVNEVLFKNQAKQSLWLQNLQLYVWSLILNSTTFLVICFSQGWQSPFEGFNDYVWGLAALVTVYGLSVSICLKKLDNVVYMYVTLMTPFLTAFLGWVTGTDAIHEALIIGMFVTIAGVVLYYYKPQEKEAEPSSK